MDTLADEAAPETIARAAQELGCKSVAFTYNDPVIFAEYAMDVADACHVRGVKAVAVTAGYISPGAREEFYAKMDAANVDLKGFTDDFYFKLCGAHLAPVLDTLVYLKHETDVWFEITTLLIPGKNDSPEEVDAECKWIAKELGTEVPLHFTAFHPDYKMTDVPPTPATTLTRSREIAIGTARSTLHRQRTTPRVARRSVRTASRRDRARLASHPELLRHRRRRCECCGAVAGRFDTKKAFGARRQAFAIPRVNRSRRFGECPAVARVLGYCATSSSIHAFA
jgi:pyruvate formate lyase activating enzyme